MFSTPRKPYGRNASTTPSRKQRLDGFFEDGQWFCNCTPRLPAVRFQVKKNTKNRNKWFYTCQQERKKQCGFFLWEDDAQVRQKGALLNGPATERKVTTSIGPQPAPTPTFTQPMERFLQQGLGGNSAHSTRTIRTDYDDGSEISTGDELDMASLADNVSLARRRLFSSDTAPKPRSQDGQQASTAKRKRGDGLFVGDSDDENFGGGLGSDEERALISLTDSASLPQRKDVRLGQFTTPSAQRSHDVLGGLATPATRQTVGRNSLLLAAEERERDAKRQKMGVPATPSAGRTPSLASSQGEEDYDITKEVLGLLNGTAVTEGVRNDVRRTLNRFALKMKGVERGRELVRLNVKAKDLKIAQLEEQVTMLESEKRADRERIEELVGTGSASHTALRGFMDEYGYNRGSV